MKKAYKIFIGILLVFLLISTLIFSYYFYVKVPESIRTDSWVYKFPDKYEKHEVIKCNSLDFISPTFAFVGIMTVYDARSYEIDFFDPVNNNPLSAEVIYTGGTTIKNTTFPELVAMVKDDCSQFQEDYDNPDSNGIDWGYREAGPPKTEEELEREELRSINSFIRTTTDYLGDDSWLTQAQKDRFVELYGDFNSMSHEEKVALAKEVLASGGVDASVLEAE